MKRIGWLVLAGLSAITGAQARIAPPGPASAVAGCPDAAFLTFEQGKLAAVDWVERKAGQVHTRMIVNQAQIVDATIDLRPDGTASHSSVVLAVAGTEPQEPMVRDLGEGAIYWSPRITSSVEQAIARARILGTPLAKIPASSLYSNSSMEVSVERIDPTDWVVTYQEKKYLVLTDEQGCMLAATLPDFGVVIERRGGFESSNYPLWPPYSAPPDAAYRALDVRISASKGAA